MIEELAPTDTANAFRTLHLLPTAPRELVDDVYLALRNRRLSGANGADPELPADLDRLAAARDAIVANDGRCTATHAEPDHSPWALLHVAKDAPAEIVELAYRYRRHEHTPGASDVRSNASNGGPPLLGQGPSLFGENIPTSTPSPSSVPAWLVAEAGAARPARAAIGESPLRIGGDPTCDIVVGVMGTRRGRTEARLWQRQGRVMFHGVAGHTSVNGHAVGWAVLEAGDAIEVGEATFRVEP